MAVIDHESKSIQATICYVGCPGSGKLANLEFIDREANAEQSRMIVGQWQDHGRSMSHTTVRLTTEHGYNVELSLHGLHQTVEEHPALAGADAIVVVIDSSQSALEKNQAALATLRPLLSRGPVVVQFNKRDAEQVLTVDELTRTLALEGTPAVEACAKQGVGVFETLQLATKLALGTEQPTAPALAPDR